MAASFEEERAEFLQIVAELYARGRVGESAMGDLVGQLTAAQPGSLEAIARQLPLEGLGDLALRTSLLPVEAQRLGGEGSVVRKKGQWLESRRLRIEGRASTYRLDLSAYSGMKGLRLELDLDIYGCSVRVKVPRSIRVKDSIDDSSGSVVRIRGREAKDASGLLVLKGRLKGSVVKVVRSR